MKHVGFLVALLFCLCYVWTAFADDNSNANDRAIAAIKAAIEKKDAGCPCGPLCPCGPACDCIDRVTAAVITPTTTPLLAYIPATVPAAKPTRLLVSSYASISTGRKNGDTVIVSVNCDCPQTSYPSAVALSDGDNMRGGEYVIVGRWFDGNIYALGRLPTDAKDQEIRKIVDDYNKLQVAEQKAAQAALAPQVVYVQAPMMGGGGCGGTPTMMGGGYGGPMLFSGVGGGGCANGSCR